MRTVSICAYNRPEYLHEVLIGLGIAREFCPEFNARVIIGVDHGAPEPVLVLAHMHADEVIEWPEHLGVSEHPRRLLQYVFTEVESNFNLHLEDDTVLSPDALRLALWFERHDECGEILSLHSKSTDYENPGCVRPRPDFGVWGWVADDLVWEQWLAPTWNHRRTPPLGFDYSITDTLKQNGLIVLSPALSRVHNIGRENGAHQSPEGYDEEMKGLVWAGIEHAKEANEFYFHEENTKTQNNAGAV